ncbi:hypothetical protein POX_f08377 [Penicillium oxalicum]|uniref:hypothetical protein n=1 Tax=Penicillium oxalicum TaxID=69781 RepID=UPI0020B82893|nr:hypothetical protein POX_f08377 [Penicillium oxalicum]KAI2787994.1 hypothetical protein POX_f08377 [Penicillium oxalicum]
MCFGPSLVSILPDLPPGDWNDGLVTKDATGQAYFASVKLTQFPGVENHWHETYVDCLELSFVRKLRTGLYEVNCPSVDGSLVTKFARFPWEIQYIENETSAYQWITGYGIGPRFPGHLTENSRVIGFLMEYISNARHADAQDVGICREVLSQLHGIGILHGDTNRFNFLIHDYLVVTFDRTASLAFETKEVFEGYCV